MLYKAIGVMSGSSLDGLDIVFAQFEETGGTWTFHIEKAACYPFSLEWELHLKSATRLMALDYQLLHVNFGHHIGQRVNEFIKENELEYKVALISSHGHTSFHHPEKGMTAQLGDGAAIAAETSLPVVSDLRAMDLAFGGQGAPIVPMGEKKLFADYAGFLNIGGIANISVNEEEYRAFDVCPANRVMNMVCNQIDLAFDEDGNMAKHGRVNHKILHDLNELEYYKQPFPKSLANEFGTETIYPMLQHSGMLQSDALRTYVEHIAVQLHAAFAEFPSLKGGKVLVTGGGAFNKFLIERIRYYIRDLNIELVIPEPELIMYKEALIMALLGVLRWREEETVLSSVTGARKASVGGALWMV